MEPTTTIARIRAASPCGRGYKKLVKALGGARKYGINTPIAIRQILQSNDLDDALWCLRTMPEHNQRWRLLAVHYARRTQHLLTDPRSLEALDVAERHAHGRATDGKLASAHDAARAAAALPATSAVGAASHAAQGAARHDAWVAACVAARAAKWGASWGPGWKAENEWQTAELLRICEDN